MDQITKASISAEPDYKPPELINDALIEQLVKHGNATRKHRMIVMAVVLCSWLPVGVVLANTSLYWTIFVPLLVVANLLAIGIGAHLCNAVNKAFKERKYDLALRLCNNAECWNGFWYPLTYFQFARCQEVQISILLLEGRSIELEVLSRYMWASTEPLPLSDKPKHTAVCNCLGAAWMLRSKAKEAAELFSYCLSTNPPPQVRLIFLNNLAICLTKTKDFEGSQQALDMAFTLVNPNKPSLELARLNLVNAMVKYEIGQYDVAEELLTKGQAFAGNTQEFVAMCSVLLAKIRHRQERLDEAELYFRNGIDILASGENPNYIDLAASLHYYAQLLLEQGKDEHAQKIFERAQRYYNYYLSREKIAIDNVNTRLENPKGLRSINEVLTLSKRERLLEERD